MRKDIYPYSSLLESIEQLHKTILRSVRWNIKQQKGTLSDITSTGNGDVSYRIDTVCEEIIDRWFAENPLAGGAVVICEGLGVKTYPAGTPAESAQWRIIIDPLDGTRHIMYDNRSCWILTGIAPNRGDDTRLYDIQAAIQTEVPVTLQNKGVVMKAIRNQGASLEIYDMDTGEKVNAPVSICPSVASTLKHGFAVFSNFFPGTKEIICRLEENVLKSLYGETKENEAFIFSEQYISVAGQLFMLITGRYRMVADIRAELLQYQRRRGMNLPLCTHPYDLSASLIAEEAGCILINKKGNSLDYPLDLETNCSWFCYANKVIFENIHPEIIRQLDVLC